MSQPFDTTFVPNPPNFDTVVVLQEYPLSFSASKPKSWSQEDATSRGSRIAVPFFDNLERILEQHVGDILEAVTKIPGLKERLRDFLSEISKHQDGFPFSRRLEL